MSEAEAATTAVLWLPFLVGIVGVFAAGAVMLAADAVRHRRQQRRSLPPKWRYAARGMLADMLNPKPLSAETAERVRSLSHPRHDQKGKR